jgi:hypothetical protein
MDQLPAGKSAFQLYPRLKLTTDVVDALESILLLINDVWAFVDIVSAQPSYLPLLAHDDQPCWRSGRYPPQLRPVLKPDWPARRTSRGERVRQNADKPSS